MKIISLVAMGWLGAGRSHAAEITVLSAFPVQAIVLDLAQVFQQETGHTAKLATSDRPGGVRQRVAAGETGDILILPDTDMAELIEQRVVAAGTPTPIARMANGVAVRRGAPLPDISTPEAFKQTLLAAKSIIYPNPGLGIPFPVHFSRVVLPRLGIVEQLKAKTVYSEGGYTGPEAVARGEVELSVQGINEIIHVEGVTLVGPLPKELQLIYTFSAGVSARSTQPEVARAFVAFLARPSFREKFAAAGLDYSE